MLPLVTATLGFAGKSRTALIRPNTSDEIILRQIFEGRAYDLNRLSRKREVRDYLQRKTSDGRKALIVDAGANIGAASLFLTMSIANTRIVAVESSPETFEVLQKNCAADGIRCLHAAIASTGGLANAYDPGLADSFLGHRAAPVDTPLAPKEKLLAIIPRVTVNEIFAEEEATGAFPFMVKIDIEGGEADLFSANTEWVDRTPIVVVELHDWLFPKQGISASYFRCMAGRNRDFVPIGENIFSIAHDLV